MNDAAPVEPSFDQAGRRPPASVDIVVVGAGFSGLYALHLLRRSGFKTIAIEIGGDVGGTWYWNRYPGARCDIESMQYSYSFSEELQQEWEWSERYAGQGEILAYARHVAERFDLRRDVFFGTRVTSAIVDCPSGLWVVRTDRGDVVQARFVIMATGCLSEGRVPELKGHGDFHGDSYHTGSWPHDGIDFRGKHVAVIGTGSSGIQAIPVIAAEADRLTVFQRTPHYSIPARNRPMEKAYEAQWKAEYPLRRAIARQSSSGVFRKYPDTSALAVDPDRREAAYAERWQEGGLDLMLTYTDIMVDPRANETLASFVRHRIRELVHDPSVAEKLMPTDYPIGAKRVCLDTQYYDTFNRANVGLVDLRSEPILEVTCAGIRTRRAFYKADCIVFATGFDAMTGALSRIDIRTTDGQTLGEAWAGGPKTYLGLMTAGFPNLLLVAGSGSPSVLTNMLMAIEQHVEWIARCLGYMRERGITRIEATERAQDGWVAHVNEVAAQTLMLRADSWYLGANVEGKPRVFMPYAGRLGTYAQKCQDVADDGYRGFRLGSEGRGTTPAERQPPAISSRENGSERRDSSRAS